MEAMDISMALAPDCLRNGAGAGAIAAAAREFSARSSCRAIGIQTRQRRLRLIANATIDRSAGDIARDAPAPGKIKIDPQILQPVDGFPALPRTFSITIHGVTLEEELERLKQDIKGVAGVIDVCWIGELVQGGPRGGYVTVQLELQSDATLRSVTSAIQALDSSKLLVLPYKNNSWKWRDYKINFGVAGCGNPIILVHGFGGNAGHFGNLLSYLAENNKVYAIDLLGFGDSEKPKQADYSPDLWAELVCDFAQEFTENGAVLVGNSIGSLSALTAAVKGGKNTVRGLVLLNCAGAMNRKGLTQDGFLLQLLSPVFVGVEYILAQPRFANLLFNRFRSKDNIRKILTQQAYCNKESVTDQLVDILYHPSTDEGAVDVFVKVFTGNNPGSRPEKLMSEVEIPVLVLWGDRDAWTPANGPVAKFFVDLEKKRNDVKFYALEGVGHCPHDDRPEIAAEYIRSFLSSLNW
ncbi:uncharacterized protein LOC9637376 [Selaginella moellendorffii]|nr:uncharacterized protein LOC9637376 [Selaginella moellendorffii]|eukprot:XP_002974607.2 uncharacterized protein LOC9637376 [Selaginella moellendorffii]